MKRLLVVLLLGFCVAGAPAWAQWMNLARADTTKTTASKAAKDSDGSSGKLRISWLDKQTNRRQIYVLTIGVPATLGDLNVKASRCLQDYGATLGQDVAWLDVTEGAEGSGRSAPWFSGWMFNTYPEIATLDHPRYDMQLLGCGEKERKIFVRGRTAPPLAPMAPAGDSESPDSEEPLPNDDGKDPFYVPGIDKPAAPTEAAPQGEAGTMPVEEEVVPVVVPADDAAPVTGPREAVPAAEDNGPVEQSPQQNEREQLHWMMDGGVY